MNEMSKPFLGALYSVRVAQIDSPTDLQFPRCSG